MYCQDSNIKIILLLYGRYFININHGISFGRKKRSKALVSFGWVRNINKGALMPPYFAICKKFLYNIYEKENK